MRIAFAADDSNATTEAVLAHLAEAGHDVERVDDLPWPDLGAGVGRAVAAGRADLGVVMCWTGTGTAIAVTLKPEAQGEAIGWAADGSGFYTTSEFNGAGTRPIWFYSFAVPEPSTLGLAAAAAVLLLACAANRGRGWPL